MKVTMNFWIFLFKRNKTKDKGLFKKLKTALLPIRPKTEKVDFTLWRKKTKTPEEEQQFLGKQQHPPPSPPQNLPLSLISSANFIFTFLTAWQAFFWWHSFVAPCSGRCWGGLSTGAGRGFVWCAAWSGPVPLLHQHSAALRRWGDGWGPGPAHNSAAPGGQIWTTAVVINRKKKNELQLWLNVFMWFMSESVCRAGQPEQWANTSGVGGQPCPGLRARSGVCRSALQSPYCCPDCIEKRTEAAAETARGCGTNTGQYELLGVSFCCYWSMKSLTLSLTGAKSTSNRKAFMGLKTKLKLVLTLLKRHKSKLKLKIVDCTVVSIIAPYWEGSGSNPSWVLWCVKCACLVHAHKLSPGTPGDNLGLACLQ